MRLYLIIQDLDRLYGVYLTRALIMASTMDEAIKAVLSLNEHQGSWCLKVEKDRLSVTDLGPVPTNIDPNPVLRCNDAKFLIISSGEDYDN